MTPPAKALRAVLTGGCRRGGRVARAGVSAGLFLHKNRRLDATSPRLGCLEAIGEDGLGVPIPTQKRVPT